MKNKTEIFSRLRKSHPGERWTFKQLSLCKTHIYTLLQWNGYSNQEYGKGGVLEGTNFQDTDDVNKLRRFRKSAQFFRLLIMNMRFRVLEEIDIDLSPLAGSQMSLQLFSQEMGGLWDLGREDVIFPLTTTHLRIEAFKDHLGKRFIVLSTKLFSFEVSGNESIHDLVGKSVDHLRGSRPQFQSKKPIFSAKKQKAHFLDDVSEDDLEGAYTHQAPLRSPSQNRVTTQSRERESRNRMSAKPSKKSIFLVFYELNSSSQLIGKRICHLPCKTRKDYDDFLQAKFITSRSHYHKWNRYFILFYKEYAKVVAIDNKYKAHYLDILRYGNQFLNLQLGFLEQDDGFKASGAELVEGYLDDSDPVVTTVKKRVGRVVEASLWNKWQILGLEVRLDGLEFKGED